MSGIDAPQPWGERYERYAPPATPPPNGTRSPCPICRCKPGEHHKRERPSLHAHAYEAPEFLHGKPGKATPEDFVRNYLRTHDPEDTALD